MLPQRAKLQLKPLLPNSHSIQRKALFLLPSGRGLFKASAFGQKFVYLSPYQPESPDHSHNGTGQAHTLFTSLLLAVIWPHSILYLSPLCSAQRSLLMAYVLRLGPSLEAKVTATLALPLPTLLSVSLSGP